MFLQDKTRFVGLWNSLSVYCISWSTDCVFLTPKCYSSGSCKARCQTFSKHFFLSSSSLWILAGSPPLAPFRAALLTARKSWGPQLPLSLIAFSTGPCYSQIFLGMRNPLGDELLKKLFLYYHCCSTDYRPGCGVLGSSLDSETRFYMTKTNGLTFLGFFFYLGLDSNKGIKKIPLTYAPETEGPIGLDLSGFYGIQTMQLECMSRTHKITEVRITFSEVNFGWRLGRIIFLYQTNVSIL